MSSPLSQELLSALEQLGAASSGDVPALIAQARALSPGPFADDALLAHALEAASIKRAASGDRAATWWLCCAVAMLRPSPFGTPQEEAELNVARAFGELWQSAVAKGPVPEGARWLVAGVGEPPATSSTIELARRNAVAHLERLQEELATRLPAMKAKLAGGDAGRKQVEDAIVTYERAIHAVRAAFSRAIDHVTARSREIPPALALSAIDDRAIPGLRARIAEARALFGESPAVMPETLLDRGDRVSFVGAPPPSLRRSNSKPPQTSVLVGSSQAGSAAPTKESLDAEMRAAFEAAWTNPNPDTRQAFVRAVRARYELETAAIADADERQRALEHYVAHALSQLPQQP